MYGRILCILAATLLVLALGMQVGLSQDEEAHAGAGTIMNKLDKVLANQAEILEQFEEIRQELVVIKVRASR